MLSAGRFVDRIPTGFVAALATLVLIAILFTVATREPKEARGYAEVTLYRDVCLVDVTRQLNANGCLKVSPGVYRISFSQSLDGSTAVASRGSCCPGPIAASVDAPRTVLIVVPRRVRSPLRATILVP